MNETSGTSATSSSKRPRRILRWTLIALVWVVTLLALFWVEENWRGARTLAALKRESVRTHIQLDPAAFIPPPVSDEQNFAMTPFFAPLYDFFPGTQTARDAAASMAVKKFAEDFKMDHFRSGPNGGGWPLGRRVPLANPAAVLEDLKEYDPVLEELREAAQRRPKARFNIHYEEENPWGILMPHLNIIKKLCEILTIRASAELLLEQNEAALQDIHLALHLTGTIKDEPTLITHLVRGAALQIVMQPIWEGLVGHKWSEAQLAALQTRLQNIDLIASLNLALQSERAWGNVTIERVRDAGIDLRALGSAGNSAMNTLRAAPRGWFDLECRNYNQLFADLVLPVFNLEQRRIYPKIAAEKARNIEKTFSGSDVSLISNHLVLSKLLLPAASKASEKTAFMQAAIDIATLACALERYRLAHGQFPEKLDALTARFISRLPHDVVSGESLKFRRTQSGKFVLYSVGWNESDDGGTIATTAGKPHIQERTEGDWVWQFPVN